MEVSAYVDENGRSPFEDWFAGLDAVAAAKVTTALTRLGLGNTSSVKGVGDGVAEYRIDWGPGYGIYFGQDGASLIVLLTGGTKRRQWKDVAAAKAAWASYKARKKGRS